MIKLSRLIKVYGTRIATGVLLVVCLVSLSFKTLAQCSEYTEEQSHVLRLAYSVGVTYDLGYTLAAIVRQESFVGEHIIRLNPKDGAGGSYGLTHITLEWLMDYYGEASMWHMKSIYPMKLMSDDRYALTKGLHHLLANQHRGWREMVRRYNGSYVYADKIAVHVTRLKTCLDVKDLI